MAKHTVANAKIAVASLFGDSENQIVSQQFRGGRVYAVFGRSDIDLRGTTVADEGAKINIISAFGSVRLLVPEDWSVNVQTWAVFGGAASKRGTPTEPEGQLILTGLSFFGGVEIRS